MGRNCKSRRDLKKTKIKKNQNHLKGKNTSNALSEPVFTMMDNPFKDFTDEQKKELISTMSENSEKELISAFEFFDKTLKKHDPLTLMSILSSYGLTVSAGHDGVDTKRPPNELYQAHVELIQALTLQISQNEFEQLPITPDIVQDAWEKLIVIGQAFKLKRLNADLLDISKENIAVNKIQELFRSYTQMVRNWGFHSQIINISKEIYSPFEQLTMQKIGFSASNAIDVFEAMITLTEKRISYRMQVLAEIRSIKKPYEMLIKYYEVTEQDKNDADKFAKSEHFKKMSSNQLFLMLLSHFDLRLPEYYAFDSNELSDKLNLPQSVVDNVLNYFSYSLGDLKEHNKNFFFLDNPVWQKPIIKQNGTYYCVLPQLFFSFILNILDDLIEKINKEGLYKHRANYLENKIEEIVKRRFPESQVVSGIKWNLNGTQYETDLIAFIDSYAIIIEAKSQKISKPALRGAPERIKKHFGEILVEPSIQSYRLEQKLNELRTQVSSEDPLIAELPIDITKIQKVLRVSVSLECFSALQANLKFFDDAGWLPADFVICPSMNLADFETLFDFLEHPVQIIHYLTQRTKLGDYPNIMGDELDFMGLYISTLLNIEDIIVDDDTSIAIFGMSEPLDKYYASKDQGIIIEKPQPQISSLFKKILSKLEERSSPRWTEIGCVLSHFSPKDQLKLEEAIRQQTKVVNKTWQIKGHQNLIIYSPPNSSEYALVVVLFKNENIDKRYEFIDHACALGLEPQHVKHCLVIAFNIDQDDLPYHYIGIAENSD